MDWPDIKPSPATTEPVKSSTPTKPETVATSSPSLFISYSQKDDKWKERFLMHFGGLSKVNTWSDQESLGFGDDWYTDLVSAIEEANVAVLLISPHFLTSKFILTEEVPRFLERREQGQLIICPVICEPCVWQKVDWLSRIQIRPKRGQPLSSLSKQELDNTLVEIVTEIYDKLL